MHKNWFYKFLLEVPGSLLFSGYFVLFCFIVLNEILNAQLYLIFELIHLVSIFVKAKARVKTNNVFYNNL